MYRHFFKRLIDLFGALVGLVLLSPVLLVVTVALFFANSGKPFFFQPRPGKDGKVFRIIKFKTMTDKTDASGRLLPDSDRLTKIGSFVRKTSLDEIPQLINVLKGEMSLIGPRPLLVSYLNCYNEAERSRLSVRPGITGLTGIKGRNNMSWYEKMKYDIEYVKKLSFALDVTILITTVQRVIVRDGISKEGHITTDSFEDYCNENPVRRYED